ncbi:MULTISPECIES: hypothetical protein [Pseudomonadaceae]|jgi:hypothetical protein|uniref:phosphoribosyltransferase-like protein n=1 Tax=Pseudomonadaceae TaxID=135621 RepID=UPI000F78BA62|nr:MULTISPECIES: hypothetical protein [Pseudomonadaceae]MDY1567245.1 hypothetical protein [Pseudomonas aeruginosa]RRV85326.1 hypothetical protein EGJ11_13580 [Stutzerimonas stutzeri]
MSIDPLEDKIAVLAKHAWDEEVRWPHIEAWLENFSGEVLDSSTERKYALFALSRFMYFSRRMVREMLRSLYQDHFKAPMIQRIRRNFRDTKDTTLLNKLYTQELLATRFLGVGNPSESGAHLLYFFRQANFLMKDLFVDFSSAFEARSVKNGSNTVISYIPQEPGVHRFIFFDDLVGSGTQASTYLSKQLAKIRRSGNHLDIRFMSLFATTEGLEKLNEPSMFDGKAMTLFELDDTFRAFGGNSRHFANPPTWFDPADMLKVAIHYGNKLWFPNGLGYKNSQLFLGFSHNTPDNTLPIFWHDGGNPPWSPVFIRYHKKYK